MSQRWAQTSQEGRRCKPARWATSRTAPSGRRGKSAGRSGGTRTADGGEKKASAAGTTPSGGRDRSRGRGRGDGAGARRSSGRTPSRGRDGDRDRTRAAPTAGTTRPSSVRSRRARSEGRPAPAAKKSSSSSRVTSGTQPESLSSDEYLRRNRGTADGGDGGVERRGTRPDPSASRRRGEAGRDDDGPTGPRRASVRGEACDATAAGSEYTKPMTTIAVSEDERSRCSSVSSSSSVEESYYSYAASEDGGDGPDGGETRTGGGDVRYRAMSAFRGMRSSARGTRMPGKGAFDLRGKGRKWQSALFM